MALPRLELGQPGLCPQRPTRSCGSPQAFHPVSVPARFVGGSAHGHDPHHAKQARRKALNVNRNLLDRL